MLFNRRHPGEPFVDGVNEEDFSRLNHRYFPSSYLRNHVVNILQKWPVVNYFFDEIEFL